MINVSMVFMIRQIGVKNLTVGSRGLYTETTPNIFVVEHQITNSVNVTTRRGKIENFVDMHILRIGMDVVK